MERESIEFDVLFVGGGPACLAGAIHLMQMAKEKHIELEVALIEKGAEVGAHAVSGAILNPIALKELIPDYVQKGCPIEATVREDALYYLTANRALRMPFVPNYLHNKGFHIISLSKLTRWLAGLAEDLGVNIFPGFAGQEVLYDDARTSVRGVRTGDKGLDKDGSPKDNYEPGIDLLAKVTVFGEGARGSLHKDLESVLKINAGRMPQVYETGIKEVIQLSDANYFKSGPSNDIHFLGYPLGLGTPGGGFIYEMQENQIGIGYLTALGYEDPFMDPYEMFVRFKRHPFVRQIIDGGKVVEQGARTVSTGGLYSIPALAVAGGLLVGGSAAIHNVPALKGVHTAMKSGMLAAEAACEAVEMADFSLNALGRYETLFDQSWLKKELCYGRNFAQALAKKGIMKFFHLGVQYVTKGRGMFDPMSLESDHRTLKPTTSVESRGPTSAPADKIDYDGSLFVDKLTGVYLSKTMHREDQPSHLIVPDTDLCIQKCYPTYGSPCTRFCPGNVYELETDEATGQMRLKLNPSNCFHCKTCDVKDPYENIIWTCPEGGEGPNYSVV